MVRWANYFEIHAKEQSQIFETLTGSQIRLVYIDFPSQRSQELNDPGYMKEQELPLLRKHIGPKVSAAEAAASSKAVRRKGTSGSILGTVSGDSTTADPTGGRPTHT